MSPATEPGVTRRGPRARGVATRPQRALRGRENGKSSPGIGVLVVGPLPPPYHGGAVATQYLLRSRLRQRFRLLHVNTTDVRDLDNVGRLDAANVWLALKHGATFIRTLLSERPQVVLVPIAQNRLGYLRDCLFLLPALLARRAVVVHVHAGGFRGFHDTTDPLTRALVRFTLKRARRAIVLGEALRTSVRGLVPDARVAVVPNGIEDPFGGRPPRRAANGTCTVLYLGTLMEAKGFLDVIAAAKLLAHAETPVQFVFAGSFYRAEDERRARALLEGSNADVEFTGAVDSERKRALLRDADVFVFPTHYANEAHPYVILEAMAAGLPVITTARAAIPETVLDGESGVLVAERDVGALAQMIAMLSTDRTLRARMGNAARARFEAAYQLDRWAEGMEVVLREAAAHS